MLQATNNDFAGMLSMPDLDSFLAAASNGTASHKAPPIFCAFYLGMFQELFPHSIRNLTVIHLDNHLCSVGPSGLAVLTRLLTMQRLYMAVVVVILLHDHAVTFLDEVKQIWQRRFSIVTLLFLLNRYISAGLYLVIGISLGVPTMSTMFCGVALPRIAPALIIFSEAIIGILLMLKVRALWIEDLNSTVAWMIAGTYIIELGVGVTVAVKLIGGGPIPPSVGCFLIFAQTIDMKTRLITLWFTNIVFHVMIFVCTLKRTIIARYEGTPALLGTLLLRDGITYFLVVMAIKITNLVLLVFHPEYNSVNWAFNHVFDVMLTSRFLLNLRRAICSACHDPGDRRGLAPIIDISEAAKPKNRDREATLLFREEDREREERPTTIEMLKHILREEGYNWRFLDSSKPTRHPTYPAVKERRRRSRRRFSI
ncbi:hypothetical protein OE88DRAFT_1734654 [Heliocybe sulcata]|uniref:DUF6533 domain-containing protein n=1 Tax=Heliocybe sulcata TaxID=5364 RepID=A0A5C3N891_9AGAM|nr:hypothetical protein OE88DRAFT_1734654 [Heliocybe sulcata]